MSSLGGVLPTLERLLDHARRADLTRRVTPAFFQRKLGGIRYHITRDSLLLGDDVFFCMKFSSVRLGDEGVVRDVAVVVRMDRRHPKKFGEVHVVGQRLPRAPPTPLVPNSALRVIALASPAAKPQRSSLRR